MICRILISVLIIFNINISIASSNQTFVNAVNLVKQNDFKKASKEFEKLLNSPDKDIRIKSNLYMILMSSFESDPDPSEYYLNLISIDKDVSYYVQSLFENLLASGISRKNTEDIIDVFNKLIDSPNINSNINYMLIPEVSRLYSMMHEVEKDIEIMAKTGGLNKWSFVGEFDNTSGSGFDIEFGPEDKPKQGAKFKNFYNADVTWFTIDSYPVGEWINNENHFYADNSVIYNQTFCNSPVDQEVNFRIGTSGAFKVFLNDTEVFNEDEETNNGIDTYIFKVKLNSGWNRILLKICNSEVDRNNFLVRLTDDSGKPIPNLQYSATYMPYSKVGGKDHKTRIDWAKEYFKNQLAKFPDDLLINLLYAKFLRYRQEVDNTLEALEKTRTLAPDCALITQEYLNLYLANDNETLRSMELEKLKEQIPDSYNVLSMLYREEMEAENIDKAESYVNRMELLGYENAKVLSYQLAIASKKEETEKIFEIAELGYEKYPFSEEFIVMKSIIEDKVYNNKSKAQSVLEDYLEDVRDSKIFEYYISFLLENGDVDDAIDILNEWSETSNGPRLFSMTGDIYSGNSEYEDAMEYYQIAHQFAPYVFKYLNKLAYNYKNMGKEDVALERFKYLISLNPHDYKAREQIRLMSNKKKIWDLIGEPNLYDIYDETIDVQAKDGDDIIYLLDEIHSVHYKNGGTERKYYFLAKAITPSGTESLQSYRIGVYSNEDFNIEKAEVLKADGTKLKAEINENQIVFTNLEENDAILLIYTKKIYQYPQFIHDFWGEFYFDCGYRTLQSKYVLAVEEDQKFNYVVTNSLIEPNIEEKENFKLYNWDMRELEPIKFERYMPSMADVAMQLQYSSIKDWNRINKWYSKLVRNKIKSDYFVQKAIDEIFGSEIPDSEYDRARKIYEYVTSNIKYSSIDFRQSGLIPQKPSKVLNTKMGDCKDVSSLFITLCREVDLNGELVLINTRDEGALSNEVPSINFNHVIVKTELDGDDYFIELTSETLPFAGYGPSLANSNALIINEEKQDKIKLKGTDHNISTVKRLVNIKVDNENISVTRKSCKTGVAAGNMRSAYQGYTKKEMEDSFIGRIAEIYNNAKLKKFEIDDLRGSNDSIRYSISYDVYDPYSEIAGMALLRIPWTDYLTFEDMISTNERKHDVQLWYELYSSEYNEEIVVEFNGGKKLAEVPENVNISNKYFDYSISFVSNGNKLMMKREFKLKNDIIPSDDFKSIKADLEKVMKTDKMQIALK